ncbi:MAG: PAS domain S-box protein [Candidatus Omnitrophica bacterium]|nr:PAS domain S-box protein [Candidatus Omnitrophota bacterium]
MQNYNFLQVLIDSLPIPIFYKNREGQYVGCNRAFTELVGMTRQELVGKTVYDIGPKEIADTYFQKDNELLETPGVQVYEWKIKTSQGEIREVIFHKATFTDEEGGVAGLIGAIFDVTENKNMENALRQSETQLKTLVANVPGVIYRCANDPDWRMEYISQEIEALSGYPAGEFLNNSVRTYASIIYPDDRQMVDDIVQAGVSGKKPYTIEYRVCHSSGGIKWVYERGQGVFDPAGNFLYLDGVIIDITELKNTQEELRRAYEVLMNTQSQLVAAAKMEVVGKLASGVAHEVKNPLTTILMGIDYIRHEFQGAECENIQMVIRDMGEAVTRADRIIKELLDFSKTSELNLAAYPVNELLEKSLILVRFQLDKSRIKVNKDFDEHIPPVVVDENKLIQVCMNLFLNAIQAMPAQGVLTLRTYAKVLSESGDGVGHRRTDTFRIGEEAVFVEIEDTGCGIPQEVLESIFDPFVTTKRLQGGTGLGLSVVNNIILMHRGTVTVENKKDTGAKVTIRLKVASSQPESDRG